MSTQTSEGRNIDSRNVAPTPTPQEYNSDVLPAVSTRHPIFVTIVALAFATLYAELMYFLAHYYTTDKTDINANMPIVVGVFIVNVLAFWASFSLPHRYYRPRFERYSPIIFLMREWTVSVVILLAANLVSLAGAIYLVGDDLNAVAEAVRAIGLYALVGCVFVHGLAMYVRYVRYLYEREMHQSYKIVSIAGMTVALLLIGGLYLLQQDFSRLGSIASNAPNAGILALHLSFRAVWLLAATLYCFFWHVSVLADH